MRIILAKEDIKGERVIISGEKARYLISVMRCKIGDSLQVFDGEGNYYEARISSVDNKSVIIALLEKVPYDTESPLNLILIQGILKGEKMDMVIQKTTELGVKEIIPAITERSQVRHTRKTVRWRKIAEEASRQCGRTMVPVIHEPMGFDKLFTPNVIARSLATKQSHLSEIASPTARNDRGKQMKGFVFWEEGGVSFGEAVQRIKMQNTDPPPNPPLSKGGHGGVNSQLSTLNFQLFIAIGPEGGFTKEEINLASSKGLVVTSLGKRILRAETAAITAVALIQFLFGDIGT